MSNALQQALQRLQATELSSLVILKHLSQSFMLRASDPDFNELAIFDQERQEMLESFDLLAQLLISLDIEAEA